MVLPEVILLLQAQLSLLMAVAGAEKVSLVEVLEVQVPARVLLGFPVALVAIIRPFVQRRQVVVVPPVILALVVLAAIKQIAVALTALAVAALEAMVPLAALLLAVAA